MKQALSEFLKLDEVNYPYTLDVNENIKFTIIPSGLANESVFQIGLQCDEDWGGCVGQYIDNVRFCNKKNL